MIESCLLSSHYLGPFSEQYLKNIDRRPTLSLTLSVALEPLHVVRDPSIDRYVPSELQFAQTRVVS